MAFDNLSKRVESYDLSLSLAAWMSLILFSMPLYVFIFLLVFASYGSLLACDYFEGNELLNNCIISDKVLLMLVFGLSF